MKIREPYFFAGNELSEFKSGVTSSAATTYTLGAQPAESGDVILFTSGTAVTITLSAAAPIGTTVTVIQMGAGQLTFVAGSGALMRQRLTQYKTAGQYAMVSLFVVANTGGTAAEWVISGDTTW